MAVDTLWSNVSLLLPMEGANNSTTITDVKGHIITVNGGAKLSTAQAPVGCTTSMVLDGNNDYLSISHADFAFGTGDFAIEIPVYRVGDSTGGTGIDTALIDMRTADASYQVGLFMQGSTSSNAKKIVFYVNGSTVIASTTQMTTAFKLVTLARISGVTRLFVDGTQEGGNYTDTNNYSSTTGSIGGRYAAVSGDYRSVNGYLGPIRITKGNGRGYSINFTPPALPFTRPTISGHVYDAAAAPVAKTILVHDRSTQLFLGGANSDPSTGAYTFYPSDFGEVTVTRLDELADPYWGDVVFASRLNAAGFPTLTGQTLTATGTVTASTAVADPFGGSTASALFNGAGSYLNAGASAALLPGTVFSVSGWFRTTSLAAAQALFFIGTNGSNANRTQLVVNADGSIVFYGERGSGVQVFIALSAAAIISVNTWYFFECVRDGVNAYLFINGSLVASGVATGTESTGNNLYLGYARTGGADRGLNGWLFDVQYTHHVVHTIGYTSPTAPFLVGPTDSGSGENAIIYDRVIPGAI